MSLVIPTHVVGQRYNFIIGPPRKVFNPWDFFVEIKTSTINAQHTVIDIIFHKGNSIINLNKTAHLTITRKIFKIVKEIEEIIKMNALLLEESTEAITISSGITVPPRIIIVATNKESAILSQLIKSLENLVKEENVIWNQE